MYLSVVLSRAQQTHCTCGPECPAMPVETSELLDRVVEVPHLSPALFEPSGELPRQHWFRDPHGRALRALERDVFHEPDPCQTVVSFQVHAVRRFQ